MNTSNYLSLRLQELFIDGKWIANTNYYEQLSNTTVEQANFKIGNLNTILQLTFHVNYYIKGLIVVLKGGPLTIHDQFSFLVPPIKSQEEWEEFRDLFIADAKEFISLVQHINILQWQENFVDLKYGTWLRNIEAMIEHGYYHLGQLVLIKKLMPLESSI